METFEFSGGGGVTAEGLLWGFHGVAVKWLSGFRVTTLSKRTIQDALSRLYRYLYIADG